MKTKQLFLKTIWSILLALIFSVSGWTQALLVEDFDYPNGTLLTNVGWVAHSGAGTQPIDVTNGLSFSGYLGSGIGGAANLDNTGEDAHKTFTAQTSGTVYAAFIIQTQSTNSAGYFLHFGQSTIGTNFFTRVWVNATGNGVGIGANAPATYIPITAGTPTLIVVKLEISTKISSLYVFNTFPTSEPLTADATFTETATFSNVGSIAFRQYNAAQRIIVDGIRVATTWGDAVAASGGNPTAIAPTFDPQSGTYYTSQNVSISTLTDNASIYYTNDGADPDDNSTLYTGLITVNSTTTLKARAYATGYDPSAIATATYTFPVPATTTIPYTETFDTDLGDCFTYAVSGIKPWYFGTTSAIANGFNGTPPEEHWLVLPGIDFSSYSNERMSFTSYVRYGTVDANNYLNLYYSANYPGIGDPSAYTWTPITFNLPITGIVGSTELSAFSGILDLSSISGTSVYLAFKYYSTDAPSSWRIDDISIYEAMPVITVNPSSLSGFTYMFDNGPSTEQTFSVSGADLSAGITINAPLNYQISETTGSGFSNQIVLSQTNGEVATKTIYVILKSGLAIGIYNSEDITCSSTGATDVTVTCSGTVTSPPPPGAPVSTAATDITSDGFTANWNAVTGASGYYLDVYKVGTGGGVATDLFISEYVEGSSNNKYIEIFNGTGVAVDLSDYKLQLFANGSLTTTADVALSGTLQHGETVVYKNTSAILTLPAGVTAITSGACNFNGDDALALYKISTLSYVDIFGRIGNDPGTAWTGDGGYTTLDRTLVRKSDVSEGITVNPTGTGVAAFTTLTTEWDMYGTDVADYLGSHTFTGSLSLEYVTGYENLNVGNLTSYAVSGLDANTEYYYVVRAYNDYGTSGNSNEIEAATLSYPVVNLNTGQGYMLIQAAINAASMGDTIQVGDGTYYENIIVNVPGITIRNGSSPIIDGGGTGTVVTITANNVTFQGIKVQNSGSGANDAGIVLSNGMTGVTGCKVTGNEVTSNANGIGIILGSGNTIKDNNVYSNSYYGIVLAGTTGNTIELNTVGGNGLDAIALANASEVGGPASVGSTGNYLKTNTITSSSRDGIFIGENCHGNFITDGNDISNVAGIGISVWRPSGQTITDNTVSSSLTAIRLLGSSNNTITGNTITGNNTGIKIDPSWQVGVWYQSLNNDISLNNISGNTLYNILANDAQQTAVVEAGCNWWGTADYGDIFSKVGGNLVVYVPYLSISTLDLLNCNGGPATPASLALTYNEASENIIVDFNVTASDLELVPVPGLNPADPNYLADVTALYTNLAAAVVSGVQADIQAAALAIGDDIIAEYWYMDGANRVYLKTINNNDLIKNKYWDQYLVRTADLVRFPNWGAALTLVETGSYRTSTNPATFAVAPGWLDNVAGNDLYVTVTFIHNGSITTMTQSVAIPALVLPVLNVNTGLTYATIQEAINAATAGDTIHASAGNYVENIVVNRPLTVRGDGMNSTVIYPALSAPGVAGGSSMPAGASHVVIVQASNVTIQNLTIDGDNPLLTSGTILNGADVDARNGIITNHTMGVYNNVNINHIEVKNIFQRGIYNSSGGTFDISHNTIDNIGANGIMNWAGTGIISYNTLSNCSDGINSNHSKGTEYFGNIISNCGTGIHSDNNGSSGGIGDQIYENTISNGSSGSYGIFVYASYRDILVEDNIISNVEVGFASAASYSVPPATITVNQNSIDGQMNPNSMGIYTTTEIWGYQSGNQNTVITNNNISNNGTALFIASEVGYTNTTTANLNSITGNATGVILAQNYTGGNPTGTLDVDLTCNWWGSADYGDIFPLIPDYLVFVPYLTSDALVPASCNGGPATPANLALTYAAGAESILVEFDVTESQMELLPVPGLNPADPDYILQVTALYNNLAAAVASGVQADIQAAALAIGDDIITEYYYMDGSNKVYLKTINNNDLIKNKYWDQYLVRTDLVRFPNWGSNLSLIEIDNYRTSTNPATFAVSTGWLNAVMGKDLYVTVTFIHNGNITTTTQSVAIPMSEAVALTYVIDNTTLTGTLDNLTATFPPSIPPVIVAEPYKINSRITLAQALPAGTTVTIERNGNIEVYNWLLTGVGPFWYTDLISGATPADFDGNYGGAVENYVITVTGPGTEHFVCETDVLIESIISKDGFTTNYVLADIVVPAVISNTSNTTTITECDSYEWSVTGLTYTTSGIYTDVQGCHTEILDLTVIPSTSFTTVLTVCDTYTWTVNGQTYTQSGIYTDVVGCHTEILDLTVDYNYYQTDCEIATIYDIETYDWQGNTYSIAGTYYANLQTVHGCDSILCLTLLVKPYIPLKVSKNIGTAVFAEWIPKAGATLYRLKYRQIYPVVPPPFNEWIPVTQSTQLFRKIGGLTPGTTYELQLEYRSGTLWISAYASIEFTTNVINFSTTNDIGTKFKLNWTEIDDVSSYILQLYDPILGWKTRGYYPNNSAVLGEMLEGVNYQFRVCPRYNEVSFDWTQTGTVTSNYIVLNIDNFDGTSADVSWDDVTIPDASDYILQVRVQNNQTASSWNNYYSPGTYAFIYNMTSGVNYECRLIVRYSSVAWGATSWRLITGNKQETVEIIPQNNLNVYPNPVSDLMTIEVNSTATSSHVWNLYDANGKLVMSGSESLTEGLNYFYIDASQLSTGLYMMQSTFNGTVESTRIIKQ